MLFLFYYFLGALIVLPIVAFIVAKYITNNISWSGEDTFGTLVISIIWPISLVLAIVGGLGLLVHKGLVALTYNVRSERH